MLARQPSNPIDECSAENLSGEEIPVGFDVFLDDLCGDGVIFPDDP